MTSATGLYGDSAARRSGMIAGTLPPGPARASGRCGKGRFKRNRTVRSPGADSSSVASISAVAKMTRGAKRRMLATTSRANTGSFVVEAQTVAQFQGPGQSVLLDGMALDHLRPRLPLGVDAVKRIEHEISAVSRRPRPGDDRVQYR